ncbi:MAG TPA: hypothetical protein VM571_14945 [Noviherbaspirillum sp.]|nr:hypothetical protein [Noviherbaspirillum sp.]
MTSSSSGSSSDDDNTTGGQPREQPAKKPAAAETQAPAPLASASGDAAANGNVPGGTTPGDGAPDTSLTPNCRSIPGIDGRLQQFLMHGSAKPAELRPPKLEKKKALITGIGPTSKVDCQRRLSSGSFCNPYSPAGCGGEYCGQKKSAMAGGDIV